MLFVILPYLSHLLSAFDLAKTFKENGYQIIFTSTYEYKELIEREGYYFEHIDYLETRYITKFNIFLAYFIQSVFTKKQIYSNYKPYFKTFIRINNICNKHQPKRIFIDEYISDYYFLIAKEKFVSLLNTRPSTKKVLGIPPLNSPFVPDGGMLSNIICEYLWIIHFSKRKVREIIRYIAFGGLDESLFLSKIAKKNGKSFQDEKVEKHCLNKSIKGLITYNLSPQEFEFPFRKPQENEVFFFNRSIRNEQFHINHEYVQLTTLIKYKKQLGNKIIYTSFGTLSSINMKDVLLFFRKLEDIFSENTKLELVLSCNDYQFSSKNDNIHVYSFIPQVDFLKYTNLMINHGGIGSIKECIQQDVKILAYPLNPSTDQNGCAVRVQELGFGLKGDLKKDSVEDIKKKIEYLLGIQ